MIHPTAIIDPRAEIAEDVTIGPYCIVNNHVIIGSGTTLGAFVTVGSYTSIAENCRIYAHTALGGEPQDLKFKGEESWARIGKGTVIREFATINRGTEAGGMVTELGENNFLMAYCHVAHDCKTGRGVILANNATLAGHIIIDDYAIVGGLVAIHQFVRVGKYAYIGGKAAVVKDIPPYVIASGDRAVLHGLNKVGLKRRGFTDATLLSLKKAYRIIFRIGLTLNEAIERVKAEVDQTPEVEEFIGFVQSSQRGITR
jgi:UDP-N-acetylglucosamine acyltransferase